MSLGDVCQICESAPAEYQCELCGTLACETHFDRQADQCVRCAGSGERDVGPGTRL